MKRRYWIIAAWLITTVALLAFGAFNILQTLQHDPQHWAQEFARLIAIIMSIGLISAGAYQELRHPDGN